MADAFHIQAQCSDYQWKTIPGDYLTPYEAEKAARVRCGYWRIVNDGGTVVLEGPYR